MRKDWALISIIGLILVIGVGLIGYLKVGKKEIGANPLPSDQEIAGVTTSVTYFSDTAKVMYFYSDSCHWCQKQKEVLQELAKDGYQVKPMDLGKNQDLAKQYNVSGTPTFIVEGGERVEGYQTKDQLKPLLDKYK